MTPVFLTVADVLHLHEEQLRYGGEPGLRSMALLESAVAMPGAGIGGEYLHADLYDMAAAYLFHLCGNHPFVDANKRAALAAALVFLGINGWKLQCDDAELVALVLATAKGEAGKEELGRFFRSHCIREKHFQ